MQAFLWTFALIKKGKLLQNLNLCTRICLGYLHIWCVECHGVVEHHFLEFIMFIMGGEYCFKMWENAGLCGEVKGSLNFKASAFLRMWGIFF